MQRYAAEEQMAPSEAPGIHTDLKFTKNGEDIQNAIGHRVRRMMGEVEEQQAKMAEVARRREVDPQEVLDAGDDYERIEKYSSKLMGLATPTLPVSAVQMLQADLDFLRRSGRDIARTRRTIEGLQRVADNIDTKATHQLAYWELVLFGF